jgi:oxygen-independent coproporphyrinogen-3 oxidase
MKSPFVKALFRELDLPLGDFGSFDTVYIGGGTPSLFHPREIEGMLQHLQKKFSIRTGSEITIEANPGTVSPQKLAAYKALGINRINLGVQSFSDAFLGFLGRIHSGRQAAQALAWARRAGFQKLGCDFIIGIPGQTRQSVRQDLNRALEFSPEHVSCYMLGFEKGTPLYRARREKRVIAMKDSEVAALFLSTVEFLEEKGYIHYEVSNFARGSENLSRHNTKYWNDVSYLGLGPSAHSFLGKTRWWNVRSLSRYCELLDSGRPPVGGHEVLSPGQEILEALYLGLRQAKGLRIRAFNERFSMGFDETFGKTIGLLEERGMIRKKEDALALSLSGMLYLDSIVACLASCLP